MSTAAKKSYLQERELSFDSDSDSDQNRDKVGSYRRTNRDARPARVQRPARSPSSPTFSNKDGNKSDEEDTDGGWGTVKARTDVTLQKVQTMVVEGTRPPTLRLVAVAPERPGRWREKTMELRVNNQFARPNGERNRSYLRSRSRPNEGRTPFAAVATETDNGEPQPQSQTMSFRNNMDRSKGHDRRTRCNKDAAGGKEIGAKEDDSQTTAGQVFLDRREKFFPDKISDLELFDDAVQIKPGHMFNQLNADAFEQDIVVVNGQGEAITPTIIRSFDECHFSPEVNENIKLKKFEKPTLIQRVIIPMLEMNKEAFNIIGYAHTGSGKTASYLLPLITELQQIKARKERHEQRKTAATAGGKQETSPEPYMIIVATTKELAQQFYIDCRAFATCTGVTVAQSYGDMPMRETIAALANGCDIFVATCGRLQHFIEDNIIKLTGLRFLILDEADKLIKEKNFISAIMEVIKHPEARPHRVLMFSATFGSDVQAVAERIVGRDYRFVSVGEMNTAVETVSQSFFEVKKFDKQQGLVDLLQSRATLCRHLSGAHYFQCPRAMVFVNQKIESDRIAICLSQYKFKAMSLNSDRTLRQRCETVEKFSRNLYEVIVATDVAARGLNFPAVEFVVNYDLPVSHYGADFTYIHRIGRTGRVGNLGKAISFFDPEAEADRRNAQFYIKMLSKATNTKVPKFLMTAAGEYAATATASNNSKPFMSHGREEHRPPYGGRKYAPTASNNSKPFISNNRDREEHRPPYDGVRKQQSSSRPYEAREEKGPSPMKDGQSTTTSNNDGCGVVEANESSNNNGASAVEADESGWAVDADENDSDDGDGLGPPAAAKNDGGDTRRARNQPIR